MNARTIFKRLVANRRTVFWGRRAILTVTLPADVIPVPAPPRDYCAGWGEETFYGHWARSLDDGSTEHHSIRRIFGMSAPGEGRHAHLVEQNGDECAWWEAERYINNGTSMSPLTLLDADIVAAHAAYMAWEDAYLHGSRDADRGPVLDAFLEAGWHARATYPEVVGDRLLFAYSVKYAGQRETMLRFSADLARAMRVARANGVDPRVRR